MEKRAKAAGRVSKDVLLDAPLPQATKTYTVISHEFVIDTIKAQLATKGFVVTDEVYSATDNAQIAYGIFRVNYGNDPELGMLFAFNNSYNKQLRFSCAVGAYVKANETSILSKDGSAWIRMHTGAADEEAKETIEEQIDNAEVYFKQLLDDKNSMKDISITRREYGELLGRLFVDAKLLGMEQVSLAKKEYEKPSFNYTSEPDCLWTMYNHILVALTKSHPRTWMEQQKLVHYHMMTEFDFTVFDDEEPGECNDPNQTSLVDVMEQVETAEVENISEVPVEIPTQGEILTDEYPEAEAEVMTDEDIEEATAEDLVGEVEIPEPRLMTKREIVEEYGDVLPENQLKTLGIEIKPELEEEKPKPSIKMKDAVELYGHLVSDEQRGLLMKGKASTESIDILKAAYLADQEKAEEVLTEIVTEQVEAAIQKEYVETATNGVTALPSLENVPNTLAEKEPTILGADSAEEEAKVRQVLEESGIAKPTSMKEVAMEDQQEAEQEPVGFVLPQAPGTAEAVIETPEGEEVVESVSEVDFFMTTCDVDDIIPGVDLEVGLVVTIGDEECEIVSISEDEVGFASIQLEESAEVVEEFIEEPVAVPVDMSFDIGEPDNMPPAESMLRTQSSAVENFGDAKEELSDDEAAAIEKSMELMNSKVELSPAEQEVRDAIEMEVESLYGTKLPFTYKLSGEQYNVQLETGEGFLLASAYVETLKAEL